MDFMGMSGLSITGPSPSNSLSRKADYPDWIKQFNKECLKINGTKCAQKLDELMELCIKEVKKELIPCSTSPNRSSLVAAQLYKTLLYLHLYYLDVKDLFVKSQWNEYMVELLSMYCQLEMKSAMRLQRGKETDSVVCGKIMNALWIYLGNNEDHMIHVLLKLPGLSKRHKDIFDPIFRKLLVKGTNRSTCKTNKPLTNLEYIRNMLAFKLWKRLYFKDEKRRISDLALTEFSPPRSFMQNYHQFKFLPKNNSSKNDIHSSLVTALIDLEPAIKEYFSHVDSKNMNVNFAMDDIEIVKIEDDEDEADDVIIIDVDEPPSKPAESTTGPVIVHIDLTDDEPEQQICIDETPLWCKDILKLSEEKEKEILLSPPSPPPVEEELPETLPSPSPAPEKETAMVKECSTPPSISPNMEESSLSEDNSVGLTEITSTSHPVQDTVGTSAAMDPFTEKSTNEVSVNCENFEHVDSTSNLNEEECEPKLEEETPTIKAFVVESTVQQTHEGLVCSEVIREFVNNESNSEVIHDHNEAINEIIADNNSVVVEESYCEVTNERITEELELEKQMVPAVPNTVFEQFVSNQNVSSELELHVDNPAELTTSSVSVQSECPTRVCGSIDSDILDEDSCHTNQERDNNNLETHVHEKDLEGRSDGSVYSHSEIEEFSSPPIESICSIDYVKYLNDFGNPNKLPTTGNDLTVNRNRNDGGIRTYKSSKRVARSVTPETPEPEPIKKTETKSERRVPINGEKAIKFSMDFSESVYTNYFKIPKSQHKLFSPKVVVKKDNPRLFIPDFDQLTAVTDVKPASKISYVDMPYSPLLCMNNKITILERQDYTKPEKNKPTPRARIIERPNCTSVLDPSTSSESKLPDVVMQTTKKKRGRTKQASTEATKKPKRSRKSTRKSAEKPFKPEPVNPVEQSPDNTPRRFSFS